MKPQEIAIKFAQFRKVLPLGSVEKKIHYMQLQQPVLHSVVLIILIAFGWCTIHLSWEIGGMFSIASP